MIRVLFDQQIFLLQKHGGISRYFIELIKQFEENPAFGVQPVLNFSKSYNKAACEELHNFHLEEITSEFERFTQLSCAYLENQSNVQADLVHHTFYLPFFMGKFGKIPKVSTLYDMIPELTNAKGRFGNPHLSKQRYLNNSDLIFSISETSTEDMRRLVKSASIRPVTTYLGVGKEFFPNQPPTSWTTSPYFLYCGQRDGYKNIETAYKAFAKHIETNESRLYLIGGGPLKDYELDLIENLNISQFIEQRQVLTKDLPGLYANAKGLIFTSKYEGFGFPPIEAMASGIPALVANTNIAREIYGQAAHFFPENDHYILAELLDAAYKGQLSSEAQLQRGLSVAKQYTWEACAQQTAEGYKMLLETKG